MKSIYELQSYLINKLDYDTYKKEVQPLLKNILDEHFDALEKQLGRIIKRLKS